MKKLSFLLLLFCWHSSSGQPKIITPAPSPQQTITLSFGEDEVAVEYSRIRLRGRKYFGEGDSYIVPYGKIWRTGANYGSKVTFSRDVMIDDRILSKGTYVLISWPGKKQWQVSFYKDLQIAGNMSAYDSKNEALKITVVPRELSKTVETMTITLSRTGMNNGLLQLAMENTLLSIPFVVPGGSNSENTLISTTQVIGVDKLSLTWNSSPSKVDPVKEFQIGTITVPDETELGGEPVPSGQYNIYLDVYYNKMRFAGLTGKEIKLTPFKTASDKVFDYKINDFAVNFSHLPEDNKTVLLKADAGAFSYIVPVTCEYDNKVMRMIEQESKLPGFNAYYTAAIYYLENGKDLNQALVWINQAITATPKGYWIYYQKAKIYYAMGEYSRAITTATQSRQISEEQKNTDYIKYNDQLIADAQTKLMDKDAVIIAPPANKVSTAPQGNTNPSVETAPSANSRFALVIGVKSYTTVSPLANTVNDARDIAAMLKKLGFTVIELIDPRTKRDIHDAVKKYFTLLQDNKGSVGLLFYSGHGLQIDGTNYLVPATASLDIKADVEDQCVNMSYIMEAIEEARNPLNIFILDACRNNPFKSFDRSGQRGLTLVSAPAGSYIVYSTKPGSVASDGSGRNGLFTSNLLKYMSTPNMNIEQVFKSVARDVINQSNNAQRPWIASDYIGDFYFSK
ncbi:MAG TPA: DUF2911 domain-containing protein [Chitinophagaceae bacterium]|nr:DUF2911 domain-containing protein [Chitinophagaceae bacterium]